MLRHLLLDFSSFAEVNASSATLSHPLAIARLSEPVTDPRLPASTDRRAVRGDSAGVRRHKPANPPSQ